LLSVCILFTTFHNMGARGSVVWLKHHVTGRKVPGSIPDEVIEFFNSTNPSSRSMVLGVDSGCNRNEYQESSWA
jgi:hypothetical protein